MGTLAMLLASHVQAVCPSTRATVLDLGLAGIPEDLHWRIQGYPCRERPRLRLIGTRDGAVVRALTFQPHLKLDREGWRVVRDAKPGDTVQLERAWVPYATPPVELRPPMRARRALRAGQVLGPLDAEPLPDAERGDDVELLLHRGALTVRSSGRLLTDARLGERVRARHAVTGVVLEGTLTDPGTVEVR